MSEKQSEPWTHP